jgi:hypothetical protein
MILDPYGEVIAECRNLGPDVVTATLDSSKIAKSLGSKFLAARRPEMYHKLTEPTGKPAVIDPGWDLTFKNQALASR